MLMNSNANRWQHCLEYAALSDVGLRRTNNQDSMTVVLAGSQKAWRKRGHLFMVADGMGAHAAGELASKMADRHRAAGLSQTGRSTTARGFGFGVAGCQSSDP